METKQFNNVKNQFILTDDNGTVFFQSYSTIICKLEKGRVTLDKHWDNSATTNKYRCQFLGETKPQTLAKIKSGEYKIEDLNQ